MDIALANVLISRSNYAIGVLDSRCGAILNNTANMSTNASILLINTRATRNCGQQGNFCERGFRHWNSATQHDIQLCAEQHREVIRGWKWHKRTTTKYWIVTLP